MQIAIYKNDKTKFPFLVHELQKDFAVLGLQEYPEIEQDLKVKVSEIELLKEETKEYKKAKKVIEKLIN